MLLSKIQLDQEDLLWYPVKMNYSLLFCWDEV